MLLTLNQHPDDDVKDIYFTGGFTSGDKTDFFVEYQDALGKWRSYTPDFLIHRKDGNWLIVEVKAKRATGQRRPGGRPERAQGPRRPPLGRVRPMNQIKYAMVFAAASDVDYSEIKDARRFVEGIDRCDDEDENRPGCWSRCAE